jgi:hypothetical protein
MQVRTRMLSPTAYPVERGGRQERRAVRQPQPGGTALDHAGLAGAAAESRPA